MLALSAPGFEEDVQTAGPVFLGTLGNEGTSTWTVDVVSHGKLLRFKIDTGAEVTAISESTYESLGKTQLLRKCAKTLYGPSAEPLHVLGVLQMELKYSGRVCHQPVYVIKGLKGNLLGFLQSSPCNYCPELIILTTIAQTSTDSSQTSSVVLVFMMNHITLS